VLDGFAGMLAETMAGTLGPAALAFVAGMLVVRVVAGLVGRGWKGFEIAVALFIGIGAARR
jgi:hypothetical protein